MLSIPNECEYASFHLPNSNNTCCPTGSSPVLDGRSGFQDFHFIKGKTETDQGTFQALIAKCMFYLLKPRQPPPNSLHFPHDNTADCFKFFMVFYSSMWYSWFLRNKRFLYTYSYKFILILPAYGDVLKVHIRSFPSSLKKCDVLLSTLYLGKIQTAYLGLNVAYTLAIRPCVSSSTHSAWPDWLWIYWAHSCLQAFFLTVQSTWNLSAVPLWLMLLCHLIFSPGVTSPRQPSDQLI